MKGLLTLKLGRQIQIPKLVQKWLKEEEPTHEALSQDAGDNWVTSCVHTVIGLHSTTA